VSFHFCFSLSVPSLAHPLFYISPLLLCTFSSAHLISSPLFVTWKIRSGSHWDLRGCIGTFSPLPLKKGLEDYACTSAFDDHRFDPISKAEVKHLQCTVSLLTDFEEAKDWKDWEVGKHGITIKFKANGRSFSATYLPSVAEEQGKCVFVCLCLLVCITNTQRSALDSLQLCALSSLSSFLL